MTSRLSLLRSRLARLGRVRSLLRGVAAWSAIGSSVVLVGWGVFAIDFLFRLSVSERLAVLLLAAGVIGWSFWRFGRSLLRRSETLTQTALFVERQQQIDSDLVAALEFESPLAAGNESKQLAVAVIDYVAAAAPAIRVFHGFAPRELPRRAVLFAACLAAALLAIVAAPQHAAVFLDRIFLGSKHYPTRTRIEHIFVNRSLVFSREDEGETPADCNAAQGRPLRFLVRCSGHLPASGSVELVASTGAKARNRLELHAVSSTQRLTWLRDAAARLTDALQISPGEISPQWKDDLLPLVQCDAPQAIVPLSAARHTGDLKPVADAVERAIRDWSQHSERTAVLAGEVGRLNDDLKYKITAGDASTSPATVHLIPLPIVQLDIIPHPPAYSRVGASASISPGAQLVVLEGSAVEARVACVNKPLKEIWFTVHQSGGTQRIEFSPVDEERRVWSPVSDRLLANKLNHELRYDLQVIDADGLSLETPIRGAVRLRSDKPPLATASVIHKVVLPTATPVINYRASDDFGIGQLTLCVETERRSANNSTAGGSTDRREAESSLPSTGAPLAIESHRFPILPGTIPPVGAQLQAAGTYPLPLSSLKLAKGDRLKLTLEVLDYRGENEAGQPLGQTATSEPVLLEISDESGVLAAIAEADKRSEQQLNEIIQRQLGTGGERP